MTIEAKQVSCAIVVKFNFPSEDWQQIPQLKVENSTWKIWNHLTVIVMPRLAITTTNMVRFHARLKININEKFRMQDKIRKYGR